MKSRNIILDVFKGIAILAVILYHANLFTYGYLGVEIFLVIGGYLITKSILRSYEKGCFSYWSYICNRLVRLWPLALIISAIALLGGYFTMLPDAYKNTCETAVGTATFTNNFVQYITSGDYWDTANEYKPLMHTWYLGVIFQFYVLYPFIFMLCHRFSNNFVKSSKTVLSIIFLLSLFFFIHPGVNQAVRFYLLPARLYEFAIGGLIALSEFDGKKIIGRRNILISLLFMSIVLICVNDAYDMAKVRLLLTVGLSVIIILFSGKESMDPTPSWLQKIISVFIPLGVASYSLYLWHQVILAFYRYAINDTLTIWSYAITIGLSLIIGYLSYRVIETPITSFTKKSTRKKYIVLVLCVIVTGIITAFSLKFYKTQGVVRDIPELEVYKNVPSTWVPQEYNARITALYEKPFPPRNGKKNVLVVGDSYARDWMNILLESNLENVNLVYSKDIAKDLRKKIAQADVVFLANHGPVDIYIDYLPAMMKKQFYRVGDKFFTRGISAIYNHKKDINYYKQTIPYHNVPTNAAERIEFDGMYINMMDSIRNADGSINIFTPDGKLMSHDGLHLTKAGARRYVEIIDFNKELILK